MSIIETFERKKEYDENILPQDFFNQNFIDIESLTKYSVVDTNNNLVFPRENKISPIVGGNKQTSLSFVSLAYSAMMEELERRVNQGQFEKQSFFSVARAESSFTSPLSSFNEFMISQFREVENLYYTKEITDFKSFLVFFQNFMQSKNNKFRFTLMGFLENISCPKTSGLQIDLIDGQKDNFDLKLQLITDIAFKRYLLLAEKYGFFVDRNNPATLVANIDSPAMQKFAREDAGANLGTEGIMKVYFQKAHEVSFDFFINFLIGFYNSVANQDPPYSYLRYVGEPCKEYEKVIVTREAITTDNYKPVVKENRRLLELLYLKIRFYENFSSRSMFNVITKKFYRERKYIKTSFPEFVEQLVGPAKNKSIKFYKNTGKTSPIAFDNSIDAVQIAAKLGCVGAHQMPNGKWMPCKDHQQYKSLTGT
jgi:hypothetical protein